MNAVIPGYKPDEEQLAIIENSIAMELGDIFDSTKTITNSSMDELDIGL